MLRNCLIVMLSLCLLTAGTILAQEAAPGKVTMKISGPGAIDQSTIKVGEKVSVDLYFSNDKTRRGISVGFSITSKDIKSIIHVADSGNGLNPNGDIKGYNGWQNSSVFDLKGVIVSLNDWDGVLPDTGLFVGIVIKKRYEAHPETKCLSWDIIVPETGTLVIDSCYSPPGGDWMYDNNEDPAWGGPYTFKVVK